MGPRPGTKGFILFAHPPNAASDNDPSLGEHVDRGQRLGGEDGRAVRYDHDGREQFHRGRDAREEAQQRQRLQILPLRVPRSVILPAGAARIRGLDTGRKDDVVGDGDDAKAHRLALLCQRGDVLWRRHGTAWWQRKTKVHCVSPSLPQKYAQVSLWSRPYTCAGRLAHRSTLLQPMSPRSAGTTSV